MAEYVNARTDTGRSVHQFDVFRGVHPVFDSGKASCGLDRYMHTMVTTNDPVDCKACLRVMAKAEAGKAVEVEP